MKCLFAKKHQKTLLQKRRWRHRSRMYHTYKELCIQLGVYDKFRLRLHGIYLSLFESPLPNGPVQKLSDAFARTHSRI